MKAIDHHLYNRNQVFYYRNALPRNLHEILNTREFRISLGTQDITLARLYVARLDVEVKDLIDRVYSTLIQQSTYPDVDKLREMIVEWYGAIRMKVGLPQRHVFSVFSFSHTSTQKTFSYVVSEYLKDCVTNAPKTLEHKRQTYEIFQSIFEDVSFHKITKEEARRFKSIMLETPANLTKYKGVQSYYDIDWNNLPKGLVPQSMVTVNNRLIPMISLFSWAEKNDLYDGKNPFLGTTIKKADTQAKQRPPFSKTQIEKFFSSPIYKGSKGCKPSERLEVGSVIIKDYKYWIPLIGLYSGMRLNEICQLLVSDIQHIEGVWVFNIDDNETKKLKTASSRRRIPIHQFLIDLGFIEYVNDRTSVRLFNELPMSGNGSYSYRFSKEFAIILKALSLKKSGLCFHSFRHTFIDGLRNAGVEKAIAMKLVGHHSENDIHNGYGYGHSLEVLQEHINKLSFPI